MLLSPNKTLQGIYANQVQEKEKGENTSRRARQAGVFKAGWNSEQLMPQHRQIVAREHRGRGKEVISLELVWTGL